MKVEKVVKVTFDKEDKELLEQISTAFDKLLQKYDNLPTDDRYLLKDKMFNNYDINLLDALDENLGYLGDLITHNLDEDVNK